ncbi:hypothetical protein [Paracoccus sp. (in: a-proteobacteria)]|uniref:hypothetical protein n=2 Tax=Paracoccus sp. TaxID=267 RepID=UPI003003068E
MRMTTPAILSVMVLAACQPLATTTGDRPSNTVQPARIESDLSPQQVAAATAITRAPPPPPSARASARQLDTTTAEQKAAAAGAPEAAESRLGSTVASLGDPTQGGFWIKTPLVKARGIGRIVNPANGKSAKVDLIPLAGGGSGSQVSLPALQLIGVSLTELPTIEVYKS